MFAAMVSLMKDESIFTFKASNSSLISDRYLKGDKEDGNASCSLPRVCISLRAKMISKTNQI